MQIRAVVLRALLAAVALVVVLADCNDIATKPAEEGEAAATARTPRFSIADGATLIATAGDIARCGTATWALKDEATANLLETIPQATVLTLGDNVSVASGMAATATDYQVCYGASWGRTGILERTFPIPGDRDWQVGGGVEYFNYFGARAGEAGKGYYSFDVGGWHVIALNSNIAMDPTSTQYQWLRADLAGSASNCTLAYWHVPRFSSLETAPRNNVKPLWDLLYAAGADVILNGNNRLYERFAPQRPDGSADHAFGVRQFTASTGGIGVQTPSGAPTNNSEVLLSNVFGVLVLGLRPDGYDWEFRPAEGTTLPIEETGSGVCHPSPLPIALPGGPYSSEATVQFDGRASFDPQGDTPYTYTWDFGDGSTHTGSNPSDALPSHTYGAAGEYTVGLTMMDALGNVSDVATTTVTIDNIAPTVSAGPDQWANPNGPVGLKARFTDLGVNDGPWSYTIDWGDGSPPESGQLSSQEDVVAGTHRYVMPGEFRVSVSVTDADGGVGTDEATVAVSDLSAPTQVLVGAGDIADCKGTAHLRTAELLDRIPGTVFAGGDNAYPYGAAADYRDCYEKSWGRHKARTFAALGNHEYETPGAIPSFDYFGPALGPRGKGYYSLDLGPWHIIVLNSNKDFVPFGPGSEQHNWLKADLAASTLAGKRCTIAIWHKPLFYSSSTPGSEGIHPGMKVLWDELYAWGAELVLNGDNHRYERFLPLTPDGVPDNAYGIREFIVGTGGAGTGMPPGQRQHSVTVSDAYGVLKLTLEPDAYQWEFIPIAGQSYTDQGSGTCHGPPPKPVTMGMQSSSNPSTYGTDVTTTATVASSGGPVTEGVVGFFDGGTCDVPGTALGTPQPLNALGEARLVTSLLTAANSPHQVTACYAGTENFAGGTAGLSQVVNKAALAVAAADQTRVYGDANPPLSGTLLGVVNGDAISATYSASAGPGTSVGSYPIVPSLSDPSGRLPNYDVTATNGRLTITRAALAVIAHNKTRSYNQANPPLTGTLSGVRNADPIAASYSTTATTSSPVGSYPITPALSDPTGRLGNYTVSSTPGTLTIVKAAQTITFNALPEKTFTDAAFTITSQASSGLRVLFSTTSDRCTISASGLTGSVSWATVRLRDVGIGASGCAITARQAGNGNYNTAADVTRSFDVLNRIDALPAPPGVNTNNSLSWSSSQSTRFAVAILRVRNADGTVTFDPARVDAASITLTGPTGTAVPVARDANGALRASMRDVDNDGDQDLELFFTRSLVFQSGHVNATHAVVLNGRLLPTRPDGRAIRGRATIRLVP
jgi:hypothetical protein